MEEFMKKIEEFNGDIEAHKRLIGNLMSENEAQKRYLAHKQDHIDSQAKEIEVLGNIVSALDGHDATFLLQIRTKLKQEFGGEGWAIGEMVERAVIQLSNEKFVIQTKGDTPCVKP